ncbi:uncharacterized protein DFL_003851 [Arthrobotrys flagrans]|uniref:Uncharacterized protein n=1 Tax=Arthrobotrys flagrans TaxID=97331 RepID=A0A437A380_ARTFL|nr:hypothetical protein DFL_003851 [Arthrobotrys flagrans]
MQGGLIARRQRSPPQATVITSSSSNPDIIITSSEDESNSKLIETSSEASSEDSKSLSPSQTRPNKCPEIPNPTRVWKIVQIIARLNLGNYCSNLLSYDAPAAIIKTKPDSTRILTVNITDIEETETEISTYCTETATVAASTVCDAGGEPERRRVESTVEETLSGVTHLTADKTSYDGVYGQEGDVQTNVSTVLNPDIDIDLAINSPSGTPLYQPLACGYSQWYLYQIEDAQAPALHLRQPSTNVTLFVSAYRPNMETYRVYTNGLGGQKYYMSIAAPVGISPAMDFNISLKTLDDMRGVSSYIWI